MSPDPSRAHHFNSGTGHRKVLAAHRRPLRAAIAAVLAIAVLGVACVTTGPTTVNVTVIATQTFNLPAPIASNQAGCPAISKIRVNYPETLARTAKAPISATDLRR